MSLISLLLYSFLLNADLVKRSVGFEWEPVENAALYEIELKASDTKLYNFKILKPQWQGNLVPDTYEMRLRSYDKRKVPGQWSPPEAFTVTLDTPTELKISGDINTQNADEEKITFSWKPVDGAEKYKLEIEGYPPTISETNSLTFKLPVAQSFKYRIQAMSKNELLSGSFTDWTPFTLIGPKLSDPDLKKPESQFVRELTWSSVKWATDYKIELYQKTRKLTLVTSESNIKDSKFNFPLELPGGLYKLKAKATAPHRIPSDFQEITFEVISGDRSPAAEEIATLRQSIEHTQGLFYMASWLLTQMQYSSKNLETQTNVNYDAFGGTGRLGVGYFSSKTPWGWRGILDLSGYVIKNQNFKFPSMEFESLYRKDLGDRGELRSTVGFYYKELPETVYNTINSEYTMSQIKTLGPNAGFEYWHTVTPKLGLQLNGKIYFGLISAGTPNQQPLVPQLSYQYGVLGSYVFKPQLTGLMGYAYRVDRSAYKSIAGNPADPQ